MTRECARFARSIISDLSHAHLSVRPLHRSQGPLHRSILSQWLVVSLLVALRYLNNHCFPFYPGDDVDVDDAQLGNGLARTTSS